MPARWPHRCVNGSCMIIMEGGGRGRLARRRTFCVPQGCSWSMPGPLPTWSMPSATNAVFNIISAPLCASVVALCMINKTNPSLTPPLDLTLLHEIWSHLVPKFQGGKFRIWSETLSVWGHRTLNLRWLICSSLKSFLSCSWFLHLKAELTLFLLSYLKKLHFHHMLAALWTLTAIKSYYGATAWSLCLALLWISILLSGLPFLSLEKICHLLSGSPAVWLG